jgi:hypothetical protein
VVSGVAFDVTVIVEDAFDNTVTTYQGTIQFATSDTDPGVVLPPDYGFSSGDAGMHTFAGRVTLITIGQQTLSVDDPSLGISGQALIDVAAPAAPPGGGAARGPGSPFLQGNPVSLFLPQSLNPSPPTDPHPKGVLRLSNLQAADIASFFMATIRKDRRVLEASRPQLGSLGADAWKDGFPYSPWFAIS